MRSGVAFIAFGVALLLGHAAGAATVQPIEGEVSVNKGQGFQLASGEVDVNTGDTVMVSPQGSARIVYADGCAITVRPGSVVTLGKGSPCAAKRMGATNSGDSIPTDHYVIGGLLVAGAIAGGIILLTDDDKSVSGQ